MKDERYGRLVLVVGARPAPVVVDGIGEAGRLLERNSGAFCVIVETASAPWADRDDATLALSARHEELRIRLSDDDKQATGTPSEDASVLPALGDSSGSLLLASRAHGRLLLAQVYWDDALGEDGSQGEVDWNDLLDAPTRRSLASDAALSQSRLHAGAMRAHMQRVDVVLARAGQTLERMIRDGQEKGTPVLLAELLAHRVKLRECQRRAAHFDLPVSSRQLGSLITDLDAFASHASTLLSFRLLHASEEQRSVQGRRDWVLAVGLAAVAFPAVWLTFWSTRAAPEPGTSWIASTLGVVLGAVLFGCLGVTLAAIAVTMARKDDK